MENKIATVGSSHISYLCCANITSHRTENQRRPPITLLIRTKRLKSLSAHREWIRTDCECERERVGEIERERERDREREREIERERERKRKKDKKF